MTPLSLSAYARHRKARGLPGGSLAAVQRAIRDHRLTSKSLAMVGDAPQIRGADLADAEWLANTDTTRMPVADRDDGHVVDDVPPIEESRRRKEAAGAALAELELAVKRAEYVPASEVRAEMDARAVAVRTKVLGVASRFRQRHPEATAAQLATLKELHREALADIAAGEAALGDGA